jgi:small-conductance mechanosensitive channel
MPNFPFISKSYISHPKSRTTLLRVLLVLLLAGGSAMAFSFGLFQAAPANNTASQDVLEFLNQTINWYRGLSVEAQVAREPSGVLVLNDDRTTADQVVRLSFDYARGQAQILATQSASGQPGSQSGSTQQYQALYQLSSKLDKQIRDTQAELQARRQDLEQAAGRKRRQLQSTVAELQSELELAEVRRDSIHSMLDFVAGAGASNSGPTNLRAQIEALARTFPADLTGVSSSEAPTVSANKPPVNITATPTTTKSEPSGIWGLVSQVFALSGNMRMLKDRMALTDSLARAAKDLRKPLVNQLNQLSQQGDQLANQADTADPKQLTQEKQALDNLTAQFKQISAASVPLSKMVVLLDLYKTNLSNWRSAVESEYDAALKGLLIRLLILGVVLGFVIAVSEVWRKTIIRYVHEPRRRYQFLLLRKIVLYFAIAIVIAFAFASEIGSVATFAGLITAGVAVALQNVILSIAGYFFLIGRFGIRVGDRVQIAGVNGEVVDVGLVRLHLLELCSGGTDAPTGRVVAFSNSIVFQPNGLFKPIPGTSFIWHLMTVTVAPDGDYNFVEKRLLQAVQAVFAEYRGEMETQRRNMERMLSAGPVGELHPHSRLRITQSGLLEVVISYPVSLLRAAEVDDRLTRELVKEFDREPKLKLVGSGTPNISIRTDLTPVQAASS